jgi:3-oxoacyl-[acyl-carrier protein] reductase
LEKPLAGKVALVTGAGRGLGRAFAERLAAMGCDIAVHGMRENGPAEYGEGTTLTDVAKQIGEQFGVRTIRILGDLTVNADVEHVVKTAQQELGPIHVLVHNAGGDVAAGGGKPNPNDAVMVKEIDVKAVLDRNLLSTILICQQTARGMMERKAGRVITISSIAALPGRADATLQRHRQQLGTRRHTNRSLPGDSPSPGRSDGFGRDTRSHCLGRRSGSCCRLLRRPLG